MISVVYSEYFTNYTCFNTTNTAKSSKSNSLIFKLDTTYKYMLILGVALEIFINLS